MIKNRDFKLYNIIDIFGIVIINEDIIIDHNYYKYNLSTTE